MGALQIRVLGPLDITCDGSPVPISSAKLRTVLGCLALRQNSLVTTDFLVEALWGTNPPSRPGPQLQVYLANLRGMLEPARERGVTSRLLPSRPGGYSLMVEEDELDLLQFRSLVAAGNRAVQEGDLIGGSASLRYALQLFRGTAFPDLADMQLFTPELDQLEEMKLQVHQGLIDVEMALGRHSDLIGELRRLVSDHPYRERLWGSLVLALYRDGRQAEALAACRSARNRLVQELGIDPSARLRELETRVLCQDESLDPPVIGHRTTVKLNNIPAPVTPIIGRESEVEEVCSLFGADGCRLVTVTGPGGTGKTRLVMAVASHISEKMDDGVGWVSLANLTHPEQVPRAIATSLGLDDFDGDEPIKAASRFLRTRRLLLVLDNLEHLEEAWPLVLELLTSAPDLRILATSRRRLGLLAEHEYELAPLALPPLDPVLPPQRLREIPAMKLFLARGRTVTRDFDVDAGNAGLLTKIVHRLDGLPLAIELAAAQLRHHSPQMLLETLEEHLSSLPGAFRDLPSRQRTLTATISWSYRLLGAAEQRLFTELGVFAGNPGIPAIRSICCQASVPDAATEIMPEVLIRHSLVQSFTDSDGIVRVTMLHSIREFARQRLTATLNAGDVRLRHARYYLSLARALAPDLWGQHQLLAFRQLQADAPDFRAALLWAAGQEGSPQEALGLVGELWHFWELTGDVAEQYVVALNLLDRAVTAPAALQASALSGTATFAWIMGKNGESADLHRRALTKFREAGNIQGEAWSIMCLSVQAAQSDDMASAEGLALEALNMPGATHRTQVASLIVLSRVAFLTGRFASALVMAKRCAAMTRPLGDRWLLGVVLTNLAESIEQAGDLDAAERMLHEAVNAALELGANGSLAAFLESVAGIYVQKHLPDPAARLLSATEAYRTDRGMPLDSVERRRIASMVTSAQAQAGPVRFGLAWAAGRTLTLSQAASEVVRVGQAEDDPQPANLPSQLQPVLVGGSSNSRPWS